MTNQTAAQMPPTDIVLLRFRQLMASSAHRDACTMRDRAAEMSTPRSRDAAVRIACDLQAESAKRYRDCRIMRGLPY